MLRKIYTLLCAKICHWPFPRITGFTAVQFPFGKKSRKVTGVFNFRTEHFKHWREKSLWLSFSMNYTMKTFPLFGVYKVQAKTSTLLQRTVRSVSSMKNYSQIFKEKTKTCCCKTIFVFSSHSNILWLSFPKHNRPEDILCSCYSGVSWGVCRFVHLLGQTQNPLWERAAFRPEDYCHAAEKVT